VPEESNGKKGSGVTEASILQAAETGVLVERDHLGCWADSLSRTGLDTGIGGLLQPICERPEMAVPRELFAAILDRVTRLRLAPGQAGTGRSGVRSEKGKYWLLRGSGGGTALWDGDLGCYRLQVGLGSEVAWHPGPISRMLQVAGAMKDKYCLIVS